jgi:ubiquinone/menaquinone biosynthesis C-methylase UbiE
MEKKMNNIINDREKQRQYYAENASKYDTMHVNEKDEQFFALSFLLAYVDFFEIKSILDVGSGTGRVIRHIKKHRPDLHVIGIEPVKELRDVAYSHGISEESLIDGDATKLQFNASEFDLVCEFGVLHHIHRPELAVSEMLRVADKAIFISDSNSFGQGGLLKRSIKQLLDFVGLWNLFQLIKTKGKGYTISEGDGLAYSYSVFNNYKQIKAQCNSMHLLNSKDAGVNLYRTASHIALMGVKR